MNAIYKYHTVNHTVQYVYYTNISYCSRPMVDPEAANDFCTSNHNFTSTVCSYPKVKRCSQICTQLSIDGSTGIIFSTTVTVPRTDVSEMSTSITE